MDYEISTSAFSGPLDLLLSLIEKHELDITKVALAQVTDEFLQRVEALRDAQQLGVVAEFLSVAARLLWIKSQTLLPTLVVAEVADEDDGDALVQQLRAYRHYKEVAQWLRERDEQGHHCYQHLAAAPSPGRVTVDFGGMTLASLRLMALSALSPVKRHPVEAVQRPRLSIVTQIGLIRKRLLHLAFVTYQALLQRTPTRLEAVVTLQAILELVKQKAVQVRQERPFGEIVIEPLIPPEQISVPVEPATEPRTPRSYQ